MNVMMIEDQIREVLGNFEPRVTNVGATVKARPDDNTYRFLVPKSRGTVIVFDSRTPHRVTPVESGIRKSLVGWVVGKRWR